MPKKTINKKLKNKKPIKKAIHAVDRRQPSKPRTIVEKAQIPSQNDVAQIPSQSGDVDTDINLLGVGLDMGTANIVSSRETAKGVEVKYSRNAFLFVRDDDSTKELLQKMNISEQRIKERPCILGKDAFDFSNYFDRNTQRPMNVGVINPLEREAIPIMNMIVKGLLWEPRVPNEICCFCVPAQPVDSMMDVNYHRNVIETMLSCFGYKVCPINEGFAVILSELAEKKFTGIGVSCGGGMTNICVAYKSVVVMEFSIAQGGDMIDLQSSNVLSISPNKAGLVKEKGMSILKPETREQEAIALFYKNYIRYFLGQISQVFRRPDKAPQFDEPIDIVFAGGTSMVGGFLDVVKQEIKNIDMVVPINEIRQAKDPFNCVSKGCLINSQLLSRSKAK
ncbi:MAG: hypothetical protein HQL27_00375 [Candidatus Omnitrophica bacterium]|nr:hypothetical protein [Candidatus Omnitrophota bacterium]